MTAPEGERDHRNIGTEGVDDNTRRALENKRASEHETDEQREDRKRGEERQAKADPT